jgi:hypothetical protein
VAQILSAMIYATRTGSVLTAPPSSPPAKQRIGRNFRGESDGEVTVVDRDIAVQRDYHTYLWL